MSRISKILLATTSLASFSSSSVYSQELFPLIEGAETIALMPSDGVFEAGVFSLNDTAASVQQKIDQFDRKTYRITHQDRQRRGLRERGVKVEFKYGASRTEIRSPRGGETYQISYTSTLLGNRVQTLARSLRFEQQVSIDALRKSIFEKYGQPSKEDVWSSSVQFLYEYQDGRLLSADEIGSNVPIGETCRYSQNDMPIRKDRQYRFDANREVRWPNCQGGIFIQYSIGDRDDLADYFEVKMWNYQLVNQNLITQDRFLDAALDQAIGNLSGSASPKL